MKSPQRHSADNTKTNSVPIADIKIKSAFEKTESKFSAVKLN
jgi:hypothetical protein